MISGEPEPHVVAFTVAAWGPAFGYPGLPVFDGEQFADQGPDVAYADRAQVVVEASSEATLAAVIDQAADRFGVRWTDQRPVSEVIHWVAFFDDGDQDGMEYDYDRWSAAIRVIGPDGEPSWPVRWSEIRIHELLLTSASGELDGDPLRPYLWPVIPQGELSDVASALWATWSMWEHYLSARETVGILAALRERIQRGRNASEEDRSAWEKWLRRPHLLLSYLDASPRTTTDISDATGLPKSQVVDGMWSLGYALGDDGRWRPGGDAAATVLHAGLNDIRRVGQGPEDLNDAAERVKSLIEEAQRR